MWYTKLRYVLWFLGTLIILGIILDIMLVVTNWSNFADLGKVLDENLTNLTISLTAICTAYLLRDRRH